MEIFVVAVNRDFWEGNDLIVTSNTEKDYGTTLIERTAVSFWMSRNVPAKGEEEGDLNQPMLTCLASTNLR